MKLGLAALTQGQPFCAGAVVCHRGRLVLTLNDDHMPADVQGAVRVGAVGGGQEPGENVWECALREAHEELGVAVDLVPAPATWFYDWEERELRRVEQAEDELAPLLVTRSERPEPDVPFRPGLPTGPYLYSAEFLARAGEAAELRPGSDLVGLLLLPLTSWPLLETGASLAELERAGAEVVGVRAIDAGTRLWVHPHEGLRLTRPLLDEPDVRAVLGR